MGTHTLYSCQVLTLCHFQFRHLCNGKKVGLSMSNPRVPKTERCEIDNHHLQSNTPKFEEEVVVVVVQENHDRKRRFEEKFRKFTKLKEKWHDEKKKEPKMEEIWNNIQQTRCEVSKLQSKIIIKGHTNQLELLEEKTDLVGAREMEIKANM
jgi:hypothetical protein